MEQIGSILDAASASETATRHRPERNVALSAAALTSVCAQPRFLEARRAAASQIIEDHAGNRILNTVFSDRGRFLIGMFVQYLHHVRLDGEADAGLTAGRLRALCVETGVSSPGRATAMLGLMRFAGYLTPAPGRGDRRQRLLVPTQRLVTLQRRRWTRHLEALSIIMPEGQAGLDHLGEPAFEANYLRHLVGEVIAGFRFGHYVPELDPYFERSAALLIFIQLVELVDAQGGEAATSISTLASQSSVARAQVRKILDQAATGGFVERARGSREPIVVRPSLIEGVNRFFAASFLYTAHCVCRALAENDDSM